MNNMNVNEILSELGDLFSEIFDENICFVDATDNIKESRLIGYLDIVPTQIIFNDPATIIYWEDGTRTVVKCHKDDKFDPEKGLVMALLKKLSGNTGQFNTVLNSWMSEAIHQGAKNEH